MSLRMNATPGSGGSGDGIYGLAASPGHGYHAHGFAWAWHPSRSPRLAAKRGAKRLLVGLRRLDDEALDAVLAGVLLEPLLGVGRHFLRLLRSLRLLPAVLGRQVEAVEEVHRVDASLRVALHPVGLGNRLQDQLALLG